MSDDRQARRISRRPAARGEVRIPRASRPARRIIRGDILVGSTVTLLPNDGAEHQYLRARSPSGVLLLVAVVGGAVRLNFFETGTWTYAWDDGPQQDVTVVKERPKVVVQDIPASMLPMSVVRRPRF